MWTRAEQNVEHIKLSVVRWAGLSPTLRKVFGGQSRHSDVPRGSSGLSVGSE